MTNNPPSIDVLRDSFNRIYHGADRLQREYDLIIEAERLGVPLETYRRLYELRGEEQIDPYPKPKKWWHTPGDWGKWVWHLPPNKKIALGRKGVVKLVQSGVVITVAIALGRYVWEAPKREKLSHYQAWQMINSATGQRTSGGRIEALQDLNKDDVSLDALDASGANLANINLQNASLIGANFNNTYLGGAKLSNANLRGANLCGANLRDAELHNIKISCLDNSCTNFKYITSITPEQIKKADGWQEACYDPDFRKQLGLPPQNPKCAGDEPAK